ncbi:vacuolar protein sorting-associated protein 37D-like [Sinocyclocheilus anshuiensis]|uniref:vacuolar protein sorting-associated protein 37D-like n=1 Tax=Sinocyclocheilus anshuiensis TaxID=1608454 RepID=UPI0007B7F38B|nr:PREDICTED: vacuolar protein sorting-associated protein 37D-like [Sinocyclocheilus anshuiensis]
MLQDVQMQPDLTTSVAQVLVERQQHLHKWAAMPHKGDSMLHLDYLRCLNTAQLLELLEDEERMQETVRLNTKLQHLQRCKKILMASNCWLAEQNLANQPHLNNSKKLLAGKYQILGQMVSSVQHKQRKLETLQQKLSLRVIHKLLKKKTNHTLSQSENLWQKLIEGKLLLTDFVESLQSSQTLCHLRLFQAEKIQNLIIQAQIYSQDADFCCLGHHPNFLHSPTTINVFSGSAPVISLPGFQYPPLSPTSHLPPLKPHGCVDTCSTLISKNESRSETRRWPQRHAALQPLEKIQPNICQTP